jgi:hypothetical protein
VEQARAAHGQGASNTRAIRERRGMLKIVYICRHQFWASLSQKLSQSTVWASFLSKKYSFGSESDPNPKIWERLLWDRVRWETFSCPNPKFWDLRFGTDFLCRGGDALRVATCVLTRVELAHPDTCRYESRGHGLKIFCGGRAGASWPCWHRWTSTSRACWLRCPCRLVLEY